MPDTINRRLARLGGCDFRFRETKMYFRDPAGGVTAADYVNAFIDEKVLPMAALAERDSIHDWSYHFITFLFPEYLETLRLNLELVRSRIPSFRGETNYRWPHYGHKLQPDGHMQIHSVAERLSYPDAIYRQIAIALDVATAKIVQLLKLEQKGKLPQCQNEIHSIGVFMGGISQAAVKTILWLEPHVPKLAPPREVDLGQVMNYVRRKLDSLENAARAGARDRDNLNSTRSFSQALKTLRPS